MNPLQKNPELFAIGRFKVKDHDGVHKIIGYNSCYPLGRGRLTELFMLENGDLRPIGQGTLIARKIEDMTDEERNEVYQTLPDAEYTWREHRENYKEYVRNVAPRGLDGGIEMQSEIDELTDLVMNYTPATLKALSFGVYTGSQSDFGETVININEI